MDHMKRIAVISCSLALLSQAQSVLVQEAPEEEEGVVYSAGAYWSSKYISEGRDNLERGGMFIADGAADFYGFTAGAWYGLADTVSYDELKMFLEYSFECGPVELLAGYTRLEFFKDDAGDNELMVGAQLNCIPWVVPGVEYVYSTEADGSFAELSLGAPIKCSKCGLVLIPYILEGFDFGFASHDYNGFNNFQVGVIADYPLTEHLCLVGSVNHSWANQDVRKDGCGDESWLSVGLKAAF
ncbi:MAG: hypothetical protein WC340_10700 [Kiritimatiellia bacterium]